MWESQRQASKETRVSNVLKSRPEPRKVKLLWQKCRGIRRRRSKKNGVLTLQEDLEHATSLLVDKARDTLDTTTASEAADSRLGDTLDVVTQDLAVTLGTSPTTILYQRCSTSSSDGERTFQVPFHPYRGQTLLFRVFLRSLVSSMKSVG
jgi:hypothetical protein